MKSTSPPLLALLLFVGSASALPAAAQTIALGGALEDQGNGANGLFEFSFALVDAADSTLWTETQTGVVVVQGSFAVDLGSNDPLPASVPADARLVVTVEGDELPPLPLARLFQVNRAGHARAALHAGNAAAVDGAPEAGLATKAALAAAGGPAVAFANVTGAPPHIADGDNGAVVTSTSGGVALNGNGALSLPSVNGDRLANGAVTGAKLPAGAVTSTKVLDGTLIGADVRDGVLTRAKLAADVSDREVRHRNVYRVENDACPGNAGDLTTHQQESAVGTFPNIELCINTYVGALVMP